MVEQAGDGPVSLSMPLETADPGQQLTSYWIVRRFSGTIDSQTSSSSTLDVDALRSASSESSLSSLIFGAVCTLAFCSDSISLSTLSTSKSLKSAERAFKIRMTWVLLC